MKRVVVFIILIANLFSLNAQMKNSYFTWEEYSKNWRTELLLAIDVYDNIVNKGFPEDGLNYLDFTFKSDKKENLEKLSKRLASVFDCNSIKIEFEKPIYKLSGKTNNFLITKDNIIFWELSFYKEGYQFDCKLTGYGMFDEKKNASNLNYASENEDFYYKKAIEYYEKGNFFSAIVNWNNTLKVNPNDYHSYYDLGITKNKLFMFNDAIKDLDKCIEINPKFYSGIVARGTLSDENEEYDIAIEYYNKAIEIEPENPLAYFNKGNTYFNKTELNKACELWEKALELGADYAKERLDKECKK